MKQNNKIDMYKEIFPSSMKVTDLDSSLTLLLDSIKHLPIIKKVHILLLDQKKEFITKKASAGKRIKTKIVSKRIKLEKNSIINDILISKKPLIPILNKDDIIYTLIKKNEKTEIICAPLIGNRKRIGIFICEHKKQETTKKEINEFSKIAGQMGNIIYISSLIEAQERKIEDISSISEISKEMSSPDLDSLLKIIVEKALKRVKAMSGSVMLNNNGILETRYACGEYMREDIDKIKFKVGEGAAGIVAKTGNTLKIEDKSKDKRYIDTGNRDYAKNSYFGLPLMFKNDVLGVLNIDFQSSTELTDDCIEFLKILASNAAIAIKNTQLHDSSIRRIKRLSAIYEITKTISATLDLEKVLDVIVIKIIKIMKAKICSVYLLNKEKTHLIPKSVYNLSGQYMERNPIDIKKSLSGKALISKEVVYREDIQKENLFENQDFVKGEKLKSFLSVPLMIEDHGIGVINIYSKKIRSFSKDELDMLKSFSDQAAIAIEKAILYRHIKNDKELLNKMLKISNEISSTLEFDKLLNIILKRSIEITNADGGALMLFKGGMLYVHDSIGHDKKRMKKLELKIGEGITGTAAKNGKVIIVGDVAKDSRYYRGLRNQKSEAALPIMIEKKPFGVLNLDSKLKNNFEKHNDTLEILMDRVAVAIENSWLHERTENFNKKLKEEVMIATKSLLEANKRLIKMDETRSDFVSNVSHELRTPLTSIMGYSKLIHSGKLGELNEQQQKSLAVVIKESERLTRLINDVLDLSKLEKGKRELNLIKIDINVIIDEVVEAMCAHSEEKCIRIDMKKGKIKKIFADKDQIKQVLNNLLNNALKFTDKNGNIKIISKETTDFVEVEVKDTGRGIADDQIPKLFDKFYQVDPSLTKVTSGTGLGLPIAQHIIRMHKGRINVKSKLDKGSSFRFTISKNLKS